MPSGRPGCPEFACCTVSMDSARMVAMERRARSSVTAA